MSDILTHTEAGVLTITFNRLEKKNSITRAMYADMADALAVAQGDAGVRAVLFQGHATIYSAGNDIGDFLQNPPSTPVTTLRSRCRSSIWVCAPKPRQACWCRR